MMLFNFKLPGHTIGELRTYADATGQPMSEYLRRLIASDQLARDAVLSGAVVLSRTTHTSSGDLLCFSRF